MTEEQCVTGCQHLLGNFICCRETLRGYSFQGSVVGLLGSRVSGQRCQPQQPAYGLEQPVQDDLCSGLPFTGECQLTAASV